MKKFSIPAIVFSALFLAYTSLYAENADRDVPAGMEILKVGDARVLVPKGTQVRKAGDMNVVEDISEYSSRKFVEIDGRFERIEEEIKGIKLDIGKIKEMIEDLTPAEILEAKEEARRAIE
jgi:hypothetical protein